MKKVLVVLVVMLVFSLTALSMQRVGITAIVEHPALEAVRQGIIDQIVSHGLVLGVDFEELYQTAQGDMNTQVSIAQQFSDSNLNVAVGISTPSAQACANAMKDIPVIFSAVTDPVAASLIPQLGKNAGHIAGISDMTPVRTQIRLMKLLMPEAKVAGIIYNSGEANSVILKDAAKKTCDELGMELIEIIGSNTSEMINALNSVVSDVDFIYIGTDNTAASSIAAIGKTTLTAKVPIVAGDIDIARGGGVIGFGFDYYNAGLETGELVYQILIGTPVSELESSLISADSLILYVNLDLAAALDLEIPDNVMAKANIVVENGLEKEMSGD
ncbi:MAG TPA: ABC transporter substrate-binding protein [Thermotogota bacterium]|nr:ABC transporter substrate-binding protein [Thermotogota bacterium]HPJ89065.1 ABC transporter substrate-binding protein [Thermotogota bacterium]HPR95121.1 ABC transporter substrate-binding protein [Thermotogota bacterium]